MHVRLTASAADDLRQLRDYLKPISPQGLDRVLSSIFTTMRQLETFPFIGREGDVEGTRELSVPTTNYRLIYRVTEPYDIDIIRVLHGAMKYPPEDV